MNEKFRFVRVPYLLAEIPYFFVKLLIQLFAKLFLTNEWINSVVQILTKRTIQAGNSVNLIAVSHSTKKSR